MAFAVVLLGVGLGPLAPTFEGTPALRLIVQMFFILAVVLWTMSMALEGRIRVLRTGVWSSMLLLLAALTSAVVNAAYKFPAILTLFSWLSAMGAFLFIVHETRDRRRRIWALLTIFAAAFVVSLHGVHQVAVELPRARAMFKANPATVLRELHLPPDAAFDLEGRLGKDRVFSTFLLPNSLAGFLVLVLPAMVGVLLDTLRSRTALVREGGAEMPPPALTKGAALVRFALLAPPAVALFLTGSKGGWLAFIVAAVVFAVWAFGRAIWQRRMQILCAVLCLMVVWGIAQASGLLPPLRDYPGSYSVRYGYWQAAAEIFQKQPLVGVGLDNFADFYATAKRPEDQDARRAHNDFVQLAVEAGAIGLVAYVLFWAVFWRRIWRREAEPVLPQPATIEFWRAGALAAIGLALGVFILEATCGGTLRTTPGFWGWQWLAALCAAWLLAFFAAAPVGDATAIGRTSCAVAGIGAGLIGFLVHSLGDLDHYVGAILQTAWVLMGILLSTRMSEEREAWAVDRQIGPWTRLMLLLGSLGLAVALMYGFVLRTAESQVLRERALEHGPRSDDERRIDLEEAVRANPLDAHNHALLSDAHLNLWLAGRRTTMRNVSVLSEAIQHARRATEINPVRSEYFTRLGRLYELRWLESGDVQDYQDALAAYVRAEELFPSSPDTALNLARLSDRVGRYDVALGKYIRARLSSQEQYHIPRQFDAAELAELNARIDILKVCHTTGARPPPLHFREPRLLGWPREMRAAMR